MTFPWQSMFANPPRGLLTLVWGHATSNVVGFDWANNTSLDLVIARIELTWPAGNDPLFNVFVDGVVIVSDELGPPSADITSFVNTVEARTFPAKSADDIEFSFGLGAASSGYDLTITFENGWSITRLH